MTRYLLLLKRLIKKKSYIFMLLVVPLMVMMLNAMSSADAGLMTIGVCIPGTDESSKFLRNDLQENPGSLQFVFFDTADEVTKAVESQQVVEGWIVPKDLDATVASMAKSSRTKDKIQIIIREPGLTHMLGKEVICSRIYPRIARDMAIDYVGNKVYGDNPSDADIKHIKDVYDNYGINGNLFEMGYVDEDANPSQEEVNYLMMPLRGILALWLLLCAIAASMYYLEDEKNGLFIWWKVKLPLIRDFLYYAVIIAIPSIMVLIGLRYGGVFTNIKRELVALLLYDFAIVFLANILRLLIGSIKGLGIITPILIMASAIFSPVFIDFKEGRSLQKICPTFHYLYCIHDKYYVQSLLIYSIILLVTWYLFNTLTRHIK